MTSEGLGHSCIASLLWHLWCLPEVAPTQGGGPLEGPWAWNPACWRHSSCILARPSGRVSGWPRGVGSGEISERRCFSKTRRQHWDNSCQQPRGPPGAPLASAHGLPASPDTSSVPSRS